MSVPFLMRKRSSARALTYNSADVPKGGWAVVASCAEPVKRVGQEPAGHSFHAAALNYVKEPSTEDDTEPLPEEEDVKLGDPAHVHPASWEGTKKKKGVKGGKDQHDHYQLLGLGHLRYLANEDQIKKAYRATSLKHHPDKQAAVLLDLENEEEKDAKREELDNHFKLIQEAYEVLTDPTKRRLFDSIDEFDDDIPDQCDPKDFYKVYGPVFQRNSRWSLQQPCPDLGDDKTPFAEVDKFYDFWFLFKSWREFPQEDEFELDQAEGREHKRWMERQNAKLREKAKKEEVSRVRALVENAYKRDPRVARMKEEEKKEKQKKKLAKQASKRALEEEAARKAEEERLAREAAEKKAAEEAKEEKKLREKEKKMVRKERQRLRAAAEGVAGIGKALTVDELEEVSTGFGLEGLRRVCDELEGAGSHDGKVVALRRALQRLKDPQAEPEAGSSAAQAAKAKGEEAGTGTSGKGSDSPAAKDAVKEKAAAPVRPWSAQETALLKKALLKFPRGTRNRWEVVAQFCGRSVDEVIATQKSELQKKPEDDKAFMAFLEQRKAPPEIKSPLTARADVGDTPEAKASGKGGVLNGVKAAGGAVANGSANGIVDESDSWSEAQEVALVKALKAFPKETPARWERIMQAVPGKTKAQCFKKFQAMRETFRAKKSEGE